jgi:hypothetical protein
MRLIILATLLAALSGCYIENRPHHSTPTFSTDNEFVGEVYPGIPGSFVLNPGNHYLNVAATFDAIHQRFPKFCHEQETVPGMYVVGVFDPVTLECWFVCVDPVHPTYEEWCRFMHEVAHRQAYLGNACAIPWEEVKNSSAMINQDTHNLAPEFPRRWFAHGSNDE